MDKEEKKKQLKAMIKQSKKAAMSGRFNWGDYYLRQHIKQLEKEIKTNP